MNCALKIADRIVVLDQGQIVDQGTPDQLMQSKIPLVQDFLSEAIEGRA
jgi:phospholipid/cholesterol/gamma-HCH transport system ATP-binding protein